MGISVPSEADYASGADNGTSDFSLFPADDYIVEVSEVKVQKGKVDIFDKPKEGEPQRTYDGLEVRLRPISFANGDELVDEDGNDIPANRSPLFFDWFDPTKVGLKPVPAKARKFLMYSMGLELEARLDMDDFSTLVGRRLIASVVIKTKEGKPRRNNVVDYRLIRQRRRPASATATPVDAAVEAPVDVVAKAKEIFDTTEDELPF